MEHLEDKKISEKIDSILDLPLGYEPSLQGKWELIENTFPERKSRKRMFFAIAASLLLFIGFSALYLHYAFAPKHDMVLQQKPNINYQRGIIGEKQLGMKEEIVAKTANQVSGKMKIQADHKQIAGSNNSAVINMQKLDSVNDKVNDENILPENKIVAKSPTVKKSKKLYVEIDFNDPQQSLQKTESKVAENKVKFKVSIFKNKNKSAEQPSPPATVLKFSKEFPLNN